MRGVGWKSTAAFWVILNCLCLRKHVLNWKIAASLNTRDLFHARHKQYPSYTYYSC